MTAWVEYDVIISVTIKMKGSEYMKFYNYLVEAFGINEPIFFTDIQFESYSKSWVDKEIAKLCKDERLIRYERGVYYIPQKTPFGNSILNPNKVIERKYIAEKGNAYGFYSGQTALNIFGLLTQMPNVMEICTNNETSKLRTVKVGSQNVILRRSRVMITNENLSVLRFLELMNAVPPSFFDGGRKEIIKKWIADNGISRKSISEYAPAFPDKAMRNLIESKVIYYVAQ